ncbi:MAG: hypothetical protein HGB11_11540 [Chlorobiales bacterium]|nr:hypothetical protein [Chlorobiales bacterium]
MDQFGDPCPIVVLPNWYAQYLLEAQLRDEIRYWTEAHPEYDLDDAVSRVEDLYTLWLELVLQVGLGQEAYDRVIQEIYALNDAEQAK